MDPSSRRRLPATAVTALTTAGLLLAACGSDGSTAAGPAAAKENAAPLAALLGDTSPPQLCRGCARIDPTTGALLLNDDAVVLGMFVLPGDTVQPGQLLATVLFDKTKAVIDVEGSDAFVVKSVPAVGAQIMAGKPFIEAKR